MTARLAGPVAVLAPLLFSAGAAAETLTLDLAGPAERHSVSYRCSDGVERAADYVNLPDNSLAVMTLDGRKLLLASVVAASGARYAGGRYVWWTKGRHADLYDEMSANSASPIASCDAAKDAG